MAWRRPKIEKNRSLERSGADLSLRPACNSSIRKSRAPWGRPSIKENRRFTEKNNDVRGLTRPGPKARRIFLECLYLRLRKRGRERGREEYSSLEDITFSRTLIGCKILNVQDFIFQYFRLINRRIIR